MSDPNTDRPKQAISGGAPFVDHVTTKVDTADDEDTEE